MNDKEFVLVSQGIEIYRTKSQENAVNMVKESNDEYFDYLQKCYDNYERPADNYVDLEIEYSNEKEKDKEIERLNNIINELEKWLEERLERLDIVGYDDDIFNGIELVLRKLQELKGSESNE